MQFIILGAGIFFVWLIGEIALKAIKGWMHERYIKPAHQLHFGKPVRQK